MEQKPNHICKNCGKDYFACNDCEKVHSWKSACCTIECYNMYLEAIKVSRSTPIETFVTDEITTEEEFDAEIADNYSELIIEEKEED